jgi:hypothetical protein
VASLGERNRQLAQDVTKDRESLSGISIKALLILY